MFELSVVIVIGYRLPVQSELKRCQLGTRPQPASQPRALACYHLASSSHSKIGYCTGQSGIVRQKAPPIINAMHACSSPALLTV